MAELPKPQARTHSFEPSNKRASSKLVVIAESPLPRKSSRDRTSSAAKTRQADPALLQQREQVKAQLLEVAQAKQAEVQNQHEAQTALEQQVEAWTSHLGSLYEAFQSKTVSLTSKQKIEQSAQQARHQAYQSSLEPLEQRLDQLLTARVLKEEECEQLQNAIDGKKHAVQLAAEELQGRYIQRAEYIGQREECEELLEQLKWQHPDCFDNSEAALVQAEASKLQNLHVSKTAAIQSLDTRIQELRQTLVCLDGKRAELKHQQVNTLQTSPSKKEAEELDKLELYLAARAEESGAPSLTDVTDQVNSSHGFDVDEELLRRQAELVGEREKALVTSWNLYEAEVLVKLKIAQEESNWDDIEALEDQLEQNSRRHASQLAAISQWKLAVEEVITTTSRARTAASDRQILEKFRSGLVQVKALEILDIYMLRLKDKETCLEHGPSWSDQTLREELEQVRAEKVSLEQQRTRLAKDSLQLLSERNNLLRKLKPQTSPEEYAVLSQAASLQTNVEYWEALIDKVSNAIETLQGVSNHDVMSVQKRLNAALSEMNEVDLEARTVEQQIRHIEKQQRNDQSHDERAFIQAAEAERSHIRQEIENTELKISQAKAAIEDLHANFDTQLDVLREEEANLYQQKRAIEAAIRNSLAEPPKPFSASLPQERQRKVALPQTEEQYYPLEIKQRYSRRLFEANPYLEIVDKSKKPVSFKKYYRLNLEDASHHEKVFYEKIMPLLEGSQLYKKLKAGGRAFNPTDPSGKTPEACGYAVRQFSLHKSLVRVDVRQPMKPGFEASIVVDQVVAPMIPQRTMTVLKFQKKLVKTDLDLNKSTNQPEDLAHQDQAFKDACRQCKLYPFSIMLHQAAPVEVIARDYLTFKLWVNGLNALVRFKRQLSRLQTRIETYTTV